MDALHTDNTNKNNTNDIYDTDTYSYTSNVNAS